MRTLRNFFLVATLALCVMPRVHAQTPITQQAPSPKSAMPSTI